MERKASEEALGEMMRQYFYFTHKWRDRGYMACPKCGGLVKYCPRCHQDMLLLKATTYPDFLIAPVYAYVECKQGEADWDLWDVSVNQVERLNECPQTGWIFLLLGNGRAPKGKEAYLIEWEWFKLARERIKESSKYQSVCFRKRQHTRMDEARQHFSPWMLIWKPNVGWTIPEDHTWFSLCDIGGHHEQYTDSRLDDRGSPSAPAQLGLF